MNVFGDTIHVTTNGVSSFDGLVVRAGTDELALIYTEAKGIGRAGGWVRVIHSSDNGLSRGNEVEIFDMPTDDMEVSAIHLLADHSDGDYLYFAQGRVALYSSRRGQHRVFRSVDGGASWTATHEVSSDSHRYEEVKLAQSPNDPSEVVYAVRENEANHESRILIYGSSNRGATFRSRALAVPPSKEPLLSDLMYMDDGTLVLMYCMDPVVGAKEWYIKRSTNDGFSWGAAVKVNTDGCEGLVEVGNGSLAQAGTALHAVWGCNNQIMHTRSENGGVTWAEADVIANDLTLQDGEPELVFSETQGVLVLGYVSYEYAGHERYVYRILGNEWSDKARINNHAGYAMKENEAEGLVFDSNGILYAGFMDKSRDFGDAEDAAIAISDPNYRPLTSPMSITVDDATLSSSVNRNEFLDFGLSASNRGDATETFDVWITYEGENGISGTMATFSDLSVEPDSSVAGTFSTFVPDVSPKQTYRVTAHLGDASIGDARETDNFLIHVR